MDVLSKRIAAEHVSKGDFAVTVSLAGFEGGGLLEEIGRQASRGVLEPGDLNLGTLGARLAQGGSIIVLTRLDQAKNPTRTASS